MSENRQVPYLYTLLGDNGEYLEIEGARSITCYTSGAETNIVNSDGQDINLPDGVAIQLDADTGNTFTQVVITPKGGATAIVSMLGGNATQF
jgi:phage gp45-like